MKLTNMLKTSGSFLIAVAFAVLNVKSVNANTLQKQPTPKATPAAKYIVIRRENPDGTKALKERVIMKSASKRVTVGDTTYSYRKRILPYPDQNSSTFENAQVFIPNPKGSWKTPISNWTWSPTAGTLIAYRDSWQYHRQVMPYGEINFEYDGSMVGKPTGPATLWVTYTGVEKGVSRTSQYKLNLHDPYEVVPSSRDNFTPGSKWRQWKINPQTRMYDPNGSRMGVDNNGPESVTPTWTYGGTVAFTLGFTPNLGFKVTDLLTLGISFNASATVTGQLNATIPVSVPSGYEAYPQAHLEYRTYHYQVKHFKPEGHIGTYQQDVDKEYSIKATWTKPRPIGSGVAGDE